MRALVALLLLVTACATTAENVFADELKDKPEARPQGQLEGRVFEFRDPDRPLRGAKVSVGNRNTTTDADGTFVLDGLRDGEAELNVALTGHRPVRETLTLPMKEVVRVGMHSTGTIAVELPKSAEFQTRLILRHEGVDQAQFNGELLDGTYQVQLELEHRAGECRWKRAQEVEVDLVDGETRKVDFRFEPPMTISGEVKDAKKKPVAGAKVIASRVFEHNSLLKILTDGATGFLEESRCVTDAFGRFTLEGLEAGTFHVLAHHPDHPPVSLEVEAGDQQAKFALVPPAPEKTP